MSNPTVSARARRFWTRMCEWYGARFADAYGEVPPPDWCAVIDGVENSAIQRGLSLIRTRYVDHPPTLPQLDAVMRPTHQPRAPSTPAERLANYVCRNYQLTPKQIRSSWTFIGSASGEVSGVVVDPDGDRSGVRVMLIDIEAETFTANATHSPNNPTENTHARI